MYMRCVGGRLGSCQLRLQWGAVEGDGFQKCGGDGHCFPRSAKDGGESLAGEGRSFKGWWQR